MLKKLIKMPNFDLVTENITYYSNQYGDIYSELISAKELSYFKLSCYCNKLENVQEGITSNIEEKMIIDKKIVTVTLKVMFMCFLLIGVGAPLLFTVPIVGAPMFLIAGLICKKMIDYLTKVEKDSKKIIDDIDRLRNVVHNCSMLIEKHLKIIKSGLVNEVLDYKIDLTLANMLIQKYLECPYPMIVDEKTRLAMISILQTELNVSDNDLDKLLDMAYKVYTQAGNVKNADIISLTRKNKNNK